MAGRTLASWVFTLALACLVVSSWGESDGEILLNFKKSLLDVSNKLSNWDNSTYPCINDTPIWNGLRCTGGAVYGLRLENMSLMGLIDIDTLAKLPLLRSLSFMYNEFNGSTPNVKKLTSLRALYLSYNNFSGEIPDDAFAGMNSLKKLDLARNQFTGKIPSSLATVELAELNLEGNQFEGHIPDFTDTKLTVLNLANNQLEGQIPDSLSKFNASSFSGNKGLYGKPLKACS